MIRFRVITNLNLYKKAVRHISRTIENLKLCSSQHSEIIDQPTER